MTASDRPNLKLLATVHCVPYKCEAKIYIQNEHPSGQRHLVVQYGKGYSGPQPPHLENGCYEFAAAVPHDMTEQEITDEWLLWPMNKAAPYPKWEIPARGYGSSTLFRWWRNEQPD